MSSLQVRSNVRYLQAYAMYGTRCYTDRGWVSVYVPQQLRGRRYTCVMRDPSLKPRADQDILLRCSAERNSLQLFTPAQQVRRFLNLSV